MSSFLFCVRSAAGGEGASVCAGHSLHQPHVPVCECGWRLRGLSHARQEAGESIASLPERMEKK